MKWNSYLAIAGVAAALAAAPVAAQAQDAAPKHEKSDSAHPGHGRGMRMMGERMRMGPAEHILSHRTELGLTADQVRELEAIRDRSAAKNQAHMEQVRKFAEERRAERSDEPREGRRDRRERREMPPETRAAMDSLRASHQAARQEAVAVLTDAQRTRLQELMPRRGEERQRRMRQTPRTRADSAQARGA